MASLTIIASDVGLAASNRHAGEASTQTASTKHAAIRACVDRSLNGHALHYLKPGAHCPKSQSELHWNVAGQRGPAGKRGSRGPTGTPGATGLDYKRIITVSPGATATDSGTALWEAAMTLASAEPAPSAADPYEIFVEPGVYDLGVQHFLVLPPDVELDGAGENITTIIGTNDDGVIGGQSGPDTVTNLTVQTLWTNSGPGSDQIIDGIVPMDGWTISNVAIETTQTGESAPGAIGINTFGSGATVSVVDTTIDVSGSSPTIGIYTRDPLTLTGSSIAATSWDGTTPSVSLSEQGDPSVKVANTELDAPTDLSPPAACVDDYNADFIPLDSTCN